jgi:hypothetical protein
VSRTGLVVLIIGLTLSSCGGGSETTTTGSDQPPLEGGTGNTEDLEMAATRQFEAFLAGDDGTYFQLLSRSCREQFGLAAVSGHLDGRRFNANLGDVDLSALAVESANVTVTGGDTHVTLSISGEGGDQFQEVIPHRWIFEEDGWRMDDCGEFQEAQGGLAGVGMDRNDPLPYGGVADVNGWLISYIYIDRDAEALVVELGGEPAAGGKVYVVAQVGVYYDGAEPSIVVGDELEFAMLNGDVVFGEESSCETTDHNLYMDPATSVAPGETAGNPFICREMSPDQVSGLQLRVTHKPTGDQWWFDLDQG